MDLAQPLSDEEFDELADFLTSDAALEEAMDISMLDGFLTALLIGPNMLPPSRWLPEVWGETPGQAMNWASDKQAGHMTQLVLRHMNDIHWQLTNDRDNYQPLVYEHEAEGKVVPVIDEWCTGFMRGTELDAAAWAPLFDADEDEELLTPILLYGTEEGWQQMEDDPRLAERHDEFADALADCVLSIQDYWMPARKAKSTIRHAEASPGRNDPCPCGSGKKFKKCCGAAGSLH